MAARAWLRTGLIILALYHFILGVWGQFLPRSFYDSFPTAGHAWVALLPPYNEHLLRDFGGLNLALVIILGTAAAVAERRLTFTALAAAVVFEVPHMDRCPPICLRRNTVACGLSLYLSHGR